MFKRKTKRTRARMTRVCETCYRDADPIDRILMTMVPDPECEYCQEELDY